MEFGIRNVQAIKMMQILTMGNTVGSDIYVFYIAFMSDWQIVLCVPHCGGTGFSSVPSNEFIFHEYTIMWLF